ncbi:MAG: TlpA family protein disulfide reductase [Alphaproteobacteria bacterium]|nr:TlpA family protein disulfide reductase [Alphaproteobacteria bacterium]
MFCRPLILCLICAFWAQYTCAEGLYKKTPNRVRYVTPDTILRVPDIAYFDSNGKKIYFEQYEGKKILLVFWATWCAPCAREMQQLDILKRDFRKIPIEIIAISEDYQNIDSVTAFFSQNNIRSLEVFKDRGNEIFRALSITSLPVCFFVDEDGIIKLIIEGEVNWDSEEMRKKLLDFAGGDFPMPKNSSNKTSLNTLTPQKTISSKKAEGVDPATKQKQDASADLPESKTLPKSQNSEKQEKVVVMPKVAPNNEKILQEGISK